MDINTLRGLATVLAMIAFLSMFLWAYSSKRKKDFEEAACLPFADDFQASAFTNGSSMQDSSSPKRGVNKHE